MLSIADIHLHYGHVHALKGISLSIAPGEVVTLIGANGAGKSSTLKAISGMHALSSGSISFDGKRIDGIAPHVIVAQGVSHCPEGRRIFYDLSVRENLAMGGYVLGKTELAERLEYVLALFPRMKERLSQAGGTLSGGEQQMLAIARALMSKPRLLMLDEPSLGLAPLMVELIFQTITDLKETGLTILLVEQNAGAALEISDRAYVLETGKVKLEGTSATLFRDERILKAYLGG